MLSGLRQVRPRGPTALSYAYGSGRVGRTSATEIKHILAAAGLFFAVELSSYLFLIYTPIYLLTLLLGVLVAFLIHEYAHKLAAQTYGYWAEFRLSRIGAILSLISIVSPLKIIAPGAVMIYGQFAAREDVGRIAAAGPLTNVLQSIIATLISTFARQPTTMIVGIIVASLNADLALFNLIPFAVMDGKKVFDWNRAVWLILFASAIALWAYVRFLSSPF
ncbi:MAG: site-2 protease family protein [Candidatus Bathyarchaeia archaeon]